MWLSSCFSTICWKVYLYLCSTVMPCSFVKDLLTVFMEVCLGALNSIPLSCLSVYQYHTVLITVLYSKSWNLVVSVIQLCSSPSILCWLFWVFCLTYKLENQFADYHKITCWDFYWDSIESIDHFGKNWHLDKIRSSYSWAWNISSFSYSLISFITVL